MDAGTLRAGDRLWTGGQWETVTRDAYVKLGTVYVRTDRGGEPRTRTFSPGERVLAAAACPSWCDRRHGDGNRVHSAACGEVDLGFAVLRTEVSQYTDDLPPVVSVSDHDEDLGSSSLDLAPEQARQLRDHIEQALSLLGVVTREPYEREGPEVADARDLPAHEGYAPGRNGDGKGGQR